jgi:hypothetical protein
VPLLDAVISAGEYRADGMQAEKKRYSEKLSAALANELAAGLRTIGFPNVRPMHDGPGEREFQGGLGPKRVDVSFADEKHGLLLAVSVKSICSPPYGKNLKNRFGDLCTEAINLHMRFPYSVVGGLFAMPEGADLDRSRLRPLSTFQRARMLFGTITGRADYTSAGEKFEDFVMMLFNPVQPAPAPGPWVRLYAASLLAASPGEISEAAYLAHLQDLYNTRNPHRPIGTALQLDD